MRYRFPKKNMLFISDNPAEKVKYKTTDIRKVVVSIENWLYTIRKLLHPKDSSTENKKICNEGKLNYLVKYENSISRITCQSYSETDSTALI